MAYCSPFSSTAWRPSCADHLHHWSLMNHHPTTLSFAPTWRHPTLPTPCQSCWLRNRQPRALPMPALTVPSKSSRSTEGRAVTPKLIGAMMYSAEKTKGIKRNKWRWFSWVRRPRPAARSTRLLRVRSSTMSRSRRLKWTTVTRPSTRCVSRFIFTCLCAPSVHLNPKKQRSQKKSHVSQPSFPCTTISSLFPLWNFLIIFMNSIVRTTYFTCDTDISLVQCKFHSHNPKLLLLLTRVSWRKDCELLAITILIFNSQFFLRTQKMWLYRLDFTQRLVR